jgi:hypothetical protein
MAVTRRPPPPHNRALIRGHEAGKDCAAAGQQLFARRPEPFSLDEVNAAVIEAAEKVAHAAAAGVDPIEAGYRAAAFVLRQACYDIRNKSDMTAYFANRAAWDAWVEAYEWKDARQ